MQTSGVKIRSPLGNLPSLLVINTINKIHVFAALLSKDKVMSINALHFPMFCIKQGCTITYHTSFLFLWITYHPSLKQRLSKIVIFLIIADSWTHLMEFSPTTVAASTTHPYSTIYNVHTVIDEGQVWCGAAWNIQYIHKVCISFYLQPWSYMLLQPRIYCCLPA